MFWPEGVYLVNRALWSSFALAGLLLGYWRFHFIATSDSGRQGGAEAPRVLTAAAATGHGVLVWLESDVHHRGRVPAA